MTEKERYEVLLDALAEQLKAKDDTITLKDCQIYSLKKKLEEAETHEKQKPTKLEIR